MDCGRCVRGTAARAGWIAALLGLALLFSGAQAQEKTSSSANTIKLDTTGLALAPAESAFFSSSLNLRESCLREIESGFVGQLRQTAYGQELESFLKDRWENADPQTEQVKRMLTGAIARDVIQLLSDMSAQECFVFGDKNWSGFLDAFAELQYQTAGMNGRDPSLMKDYFLSLDKAFFDAIPIPTTVIGFQLSEDGNARTQLDAFEGIVRLALGGAENLKQFSKNLKRADLANGQTLSMTFQADDIRWDNIPIPNADAQEVVDHVAEMIAGRKIVLSVGVLDNRFLFSISEKADTLVSLGKGANLLSSPAMQQLAQNQPAQLNSIQYSSGEFRQASMDSNFANYFERIAMQITGPLEEQFDSDEFQDWREKLLDDCEWLDEKMAEILPKYAAMLAYSFASPDGIETYAYDWTPNWLLENAKPLAITSHAGSAPLLFLAMRQKWSNGVGEIVSATLDELPNHVEALVDSGMLEDEQATQLEEAAEKVLPIIEDLVAAFRDKILAGMDGNESVTALTAQATVSKLNEYAPPAPAALPIPELSVAVKLKNRDLFLSGCDQVIQSLNALIDMARQTNPSNIPPGVRVPDAREETLADGGKRYSFPLGVPAPWDQFEIQMALNKEAAILGYSTRQVKDMYESRPLAARPAWYTDSDPIAAVGYLDIAGVFKAIKPWVQYGLASLERDMDEPLAPATDAPVPSGNDVLEMWDCFSKLGKSAGTTTVDKNGVTVSRWIWVSE